VKPHALPGILGAIERLTCTEIALEIARHWGGIRLYIPKDIKDRGHPLAKIAGMKAATLLAASELGGHVHNIPAARAVLRSNEVHRLYTEENLGLSEIALRTRLTRQHVASLLEGVERNAAPPGRHAVPVIAERCPLCGRRRAGRRAVDPRQWPLPLPSIAS
jgi:hypothetical protein